MDCNYDRCPSVIVCQHTPPPPLLILLLHCCHSTSTSLLPLSLSLSLSLLPLPPPTKVPLFSFPFLIPARDLCTLSLLSLFLSLVLRTPRLSHRHYGCSLCDLARYGQHGIGCSPPGLALFSPVDSMNTTANIAFSLHRLC